MRDLKARLAALEERVEALEMGLADFEQAVEDLEGMACFSPGPCRCPSH